MNKFPKNFLAKARSWITTNKLHGPHAFLRFIILVFVELLNQSSDEFIFKGGNLLWVYIKTPRSTVDVDFVTRSLVDSKLVQKALEDACRQQDSNVIFSIKSFQTIETQGNLGSAVTIHYRTDQGQENSFDLDIVYGIPSNITTIASPLEDSKTIRVVTIENIVADKIATCHRFRSGNSRMKDFDDLWRISVVAPDLINWKVLSKILVDRNIPTFLNLDWISTQMERSWKAHLKRNAGLPIELSALMGMVNEWLKKGFTGNL